MNTKMASMVYSTTSPMLITDEEDLKFLNESVMGPEEVNGSYSHNIQDSYGANMLGCTQLIEGQSTPNSKSNSALSNTRDSSYKRYLSIEDFLSEKEEFSSPVRLPRPTTDVTEKLKQAAAASATGEEDSFDKHESLDEYIDDVASESDTSQLEWEDFDHDASVIFNREKADLSVDHSICSDSSASLNYLYEQLITPLTVNDQILIKTIIKEMERLLKPKISYLQSTAQKYELLKSVCNIPSIENLRTLQDAERLKEQIKLSFENSVESNSLSSSKKRKFNEIIESPLFEEIFSQLTGTPNTSTASNEQEMQKKSEAAAEILKNIKGLGITLPKEGGSNTNEGKPPASPPLSAKVIRRFLDNDNISEKDEDYDMTNLNLSDWEGTAAKAFSSPALYPISEHEKFMDSVEDLVSEDNSSSIYEKQEVIFTQNNNSFELVRQIFDEDEPELEVEPFSQKEFDLLEFCLDSVPSMKDSSLKKNPFFCIEGYTSSLDELSRSTYSTTKDCRRIDDLSTAELEYRLSKFTENTTQKKKNISSKVHQLINVFENPNSNTKIFHNSSSRRNSSDVSQYKGKRIKNIPEQSLALVIQTELQDRKRKGKAGPNLSYLDMLKKYYRDDPHFKQAFVSKYHVLCLSGLWPSTAGEVETVVSGNSTTGRANSRKDKKTVDKSKKRFSGLFK